MHHGREAPAAAGAAAHQGERPALQDREVERELAARGGASDDEPAAGLEARAALVPYGRAHAVEDDVDPTPAGEILHARAELRCGRVVDDIVGAQLLRLRELPVAPSGDDRACAHAFGHQEAEATHAAADCLDQDVLALLKLHTFEETVPGGVTGQRKRRRLLEPHVLGDRLKIRRRHLAVLRVAAVELAAQALLPLAELVAPEDARRADAALDAVLDHDAVALLPAGHARSQLRDLARNVEAEDPRQPARRRASGAQRQIGVIDRRRAYAHDDLAGACHRIWAVAEDQLLRAPGLGDVDGLHRKIAWHFGALKIQVSTQSTSSIFAPTSAIAPARHTQFSTSCWPEASSRSSGSSRQVS